MKRSVARSVVTSAVIYVTYVSFLLLSCLFCISGTIRFAVIHKGKMEGILAEYRIQLRFGAWIQEPKILLNTMEDALGIVILLILLFIILVILGKSIKVVHQGTLMIVERFGQYDVACLFWGE